jgi:FlaA1/EpsC-like NDP-sugar epimerase
MSKIIGITGGTGFLADALIRRLLKWHKKPRIRVLARNEGKLYKLLEKYPTLEVVAGDIADNYIARKFMKDLDTCFHLAAFKYVDKAEIEPYQCVRSNILGTLNVLKWSYVYKPRMVLGISTDKAAQIRGVYGATKYIMEKLFQEAERINPKTKYRIVRYGNVLYSTGSALCKWRNKINRREPICVTNPRATRFFFTREQAIDLIVECVKKQKNAQPKIPKMRAVAIGDLALAVTEKYGKVKIEITELNSADNMHETLDGKVFSNQVKLYSINQIKKLI